MKVRRIHHLRIKHATRQCGWRIRVRRVWEKIELNSTYGRMSNRWTVRSYQHGLIDSIRNSARDVIKLDGIQA